MQIVSNDKIRGVSLLRQGDIFTILAKELLDFLLKQHFPMHLPFREEEQDIEEVGNFMNSNRSEKILQCFLVCRVKATIASFQPMKAAGLDDLKPVVIQHIGDEALARITIFFKRLMLSSFIPNESSLHPQAGKGRLLGAEGLQTDNLIKLSPKGDEESPKLVPQ